MATAGGKVTAFAAEFVQRVAAGITTALTGSAPDWFGPSDPTPAVAPEGTAGRQFDYGTGINMNNTPRQGELYGFAVMRTLADSSDLLRVIGVTDTKAVPLKRVASGPTAGQYSVDEVTGTYTFAVADAGKTVFINFRYTATITGAQGGTIMNVDMGNAPTFALDLMQAYKGKILHFKFYRCMSNKLGMATKQDDYNIPDFEFEAFADDTGRVFDWYISE